MKNKNSLTHNAIFNVAYKVLNVIFPLLSATYVARVLLPSGVGRISYAQNIVSYFTLIAALGIPTYGVREISQCRDDQDKMNRTFSELLIVNAISTILCTVFYIVWIFNYFNADIKLYLVCGLLLLFNFINIDWFYQGMEEYAYIAIRSSIIKIISLGMLFIFVHKETDYIKYSLITCLAIGGNYFFNIFHSRKFVKFTLKKLEFKSHLKPILYLLVCAIAGQLYSQVDITMLGSSCEDQIVGFYSNGQKLVNLVLSLTTAISAIFLPRISYYYKNDRAKYNDYVSLGTKIVSFFAIPGYIGIVLASNNFTYVMFGKAFMPAAFTIQILAALILIKSFGDILCYQVIISSGNEKKLIKSYILSAIVNIILNLLLIPVLQQNGAAIASVISEFIVNITLFITVSLKVVKVNISKRYWLSIIFSSFCMGIVVFTLGTLIQKKLIALILQVGLGVIIYCGVNMILKNEIVYMVLQKFRNRSTKNVR